jgi:glutathione S-transferase
MARTILYGIAGSPYVRVARLGLEEKQVAYEFVELSMDVVKEPAHLARHPFGRIPAFEHGGFSLYETQAILRYVDRAFPGPSLQPADPRREARMNQLMNIVDWYVFPSMSAVISWERLIVPRLFGRPGDEAKIAAAVPQVQLCVREIERLMDGNVFLADDRPTLADLMLAPHLDYFSMTPEGQTALAPHQRLRNWQQRMATRDSVARAMPQAA